MKTGVVLIAICIGGVFVADHPTRAVQKRENEREKKRVADDYVLELRILEGAGIIDSTDIPQNAEVVAETETLVQRERRFSVTTRMGMRHLAINGVLTRQNDGLLLRLRAAYSVDRDSSTATTQIGIKPDQQMALGGFASSLSVKGKMRHRYRLIVVRLRKAGTNSAHEKSGAFRK